MVRAAVLLLLLAAAGSAVAVAAVMGTIGPRCRVVVRMRWRRLQRTSSNRRNGGAVVSPLTT